MTAAASPPRLPTSTTPTPRRRQNGCSVMASALDSRTRLDKWLWAARLYKSRTLAAQAIETGQARVNEERVKPAHPVRVGERVNVRKAGLTWDLEVLALSEKRGGAADA